jgi:hypothetical protein
MIFCLLLKKQNLVCIKFCIIYVFEKKSKPTKAIVILIFFVVWFFVTQSTSLCFQKKATSKLKKTTRKKKATKKKPVCYKCKKVITGRSYGTIRPGCSITASNRCFTKDGKKIPAKDVFVVYDGDCYWGSLSGTICNLSET